MGAFEYDINGRPSGRVELCYREVQFCFGQSKSKVVNERASAEIKKLAGVTNYFRAVATDDDMNRAGRIQLLVCFGVQAIRSL